MRLGLPARQAIEPAALLLGAALLGFASRASAQPTSTSREGAKGVQVELQPFLGYRAGGSFDIDNADKSRFTIEDSAVYGLTVGLVLNPSQQIDFVWSRQDTSLFVDGAIPGRDSLGGFEVDFFQIEGSYIHGDPWEKVRPFVAFGAGATHFGAPDGFSGSRTHFAFSIGGGARVSMGKTLGLRFQARWTPTFTSSNETLFCSSGGGCFATVGGEFVNQIDVNAGLTVRF